MVRLAGVILLATMLMFGMTSRAWAADDVVRENIVISISDVGDAHFEGVMLYPAAVFSDRAFDPESFPAVLAPHFSPLGEFTWLPLITDLVGTVDVEKRIVRYSYDWTGYVANMGDHWAVPFCWTEPVSQEGTQTVFEEEYYDSGQFTLWDAYKFETNTTLVLPAGASSIEWAGKNDYELRYEQAAWAPPPPEEAFFEANGGVLTPLFIVLIVVSGGFALYIAVGSRIRTAYATHHGSSQTGAGGAPDAAAPSESAAAEAGTSVCERCGDTIEPGDRFCDRCGAKIK